MEGIIFFAFLSAVEAGGQSSRAKNCDAEGNLLEKVSSAEHTNKEVDSAFRDVTSRSHWLFFCVSRIDLLTRSFMVEEEDELRHAEKR